jgi:alkylated DNA nucleotide flippase Atl1
MELNEDAIVDIADAQVRYFGGPGKMLLPSVATVEAMIAKIPKGKLMTTAQLRKELAAQFGVQGTCPVTTKNALRAIASNASGSTAYWRIVKANGELMAWFPGGTVGQGAQLRAEGFCIDTTGKVPRVVCFKDNLLQLP